MASPVWAKGIIRPEVDVDDPPMVCLPPDPMLIKGKQAGTIAEYIYIYILVGASVNSCTWAQGPELGPQHTNDPVGPEAPQAPREIYE